MLHDVLSRMIDVGHLSVATAGGAFEVGEPPDRLRGPDVAIKLHGWLTPWKIALKPDPGLGEAYIQGAIEFKRGNLWNLMELIGLNWMRWPSSPLCRLPAFPRAIDRRRARSNVAHHYDLSERFYRSFLDSDMQYSCAYFAREDMTLEEAQEAKKRHIAAKLCLRDGQHVLDVGCGWGGMALTLAGIADIRVTGVTLSREQHGVASERAARAGLADRVDFRLCDYRDLEGQFDRIVSVGMFEHVGPRNYEEFFIRLRDLLKPDGVALLHAIGRRGVPFHDRGFMPKYIFPEGHVPSLSEVTPAVERAGLWTTDIEILRLHYAETLRHWRDRFMRSREAVRQLYDDRFCRMWEFYLAGCEMAFRYGEMMVFQMQLTRSVSATPITRTYMTRTEQPLQKV